MSFEARIKELGLAIPELPPPAFSYVPAVQVGNLIFASGQTPTIDGKLTMQGKLGREITVEQGQEEHDGEVLEGHSPQLTIDDRRVLCILVLLGYTPLQLHFHTRADFDLGRQIGGDEVVELLEESDFQGDSRYHRRLL